MNFLKAQWREDQALFLWKGFRGEGGGCTVHHNRGKKVLKELRGRPGRGSAQRSAAGVPAGTMPDPVPQHPAGAGQLGEWKLLTEGHGSTSRSLW